MLFKLKMIVIVLFTTVAMRPPVQEKASSWIYDLVEFGYDRYEITRTNFQTNESEVVASISRKPTFSLASLMRAEELDIAARYRAQDWALPSDVDPYSYFDQPPTNVFVTSFAVSPDDELLAVSITYSSCLTRPRYECFGASNIDVITIATGETETVWSIPLQAQTPYLPSCNYSYTYFELFTEVIVSEIRWTPDNSAIIAQLSNAARLPDKPLVVIPLATSDTPFSVINGGHDWAILPDSRTIVSVAGDCVTNDSDVFYRASFDLDGSVTADSVNLAAPIWRAGIPDGNWSPGIVSFEDKILFAIETEDGAYVVGDTQRLAVISPGPLAQPTLLDLTLPGFQRLESSSTGDQVVIEDVNGILWALDESLTDRQITQSPVTFWRFMDSTHLAVQYEGSEDFDIIEITPFIAPTD
ncbi:MAG: hypothetical protein CL607_09750 [Anaerolineaceae bacterium]|nr:hypothetical protein [Anaerolineaceae bacterium]